jgi:hypothetical protein
MWVVRWVRVKIVARLIATMLHSGEAWTLAFDAQRAQYLIEAGQQRLILALCGVQ